MLLLTFGSLTAMGLPIVTALFGLGTGLGLIALFTHLLDTPNFSSELAAMIGLGVGIDYALFILTRFREAYRTPGPTFEDARESTLQAMDTAGRAVLFAGTTVVIALLGMMLLGVDFLYGVALSASIGVLLVMLASLTLLPALLTIAGDRVARPGRRARARARAMAAAAPSSAPAPAVLSGSAPGSAPAPESSSQAPRPAPHRRRQSLRLRARQLPRHAPPCPTRPPPPARRPPRAPYGCAGARSYRDDRGGSRSRPRWRCCCLPRPRSRFDWDPATPPTTREPDHAPRVRAARARIR